MPSDADDHERLRVLIIDEDAADVERILVQLYAAGYEPAFHVVGDPEALEEALAEDWDAILCEYALRRLSGPAVLELLQEEAVDAPVVLVSRTVDSRMAAAAIRFGVSDVVDKDELDRLGPVVARALRAAAVRREKEAAERALREREELLVQAQRMEAIGRFAAGMVHPVNNLLSVVLGCTAQLNQVLERGHPVRRYVETIDEATRAVGTLAQRFTALTGSQIWRSEVFDLAAMVRETEAALAGVVGEGIGIGYELDGPCWIDADPSHICEALVELCANARDAMPEGGRLRIAVSAVEVREPIVDASGAMARGRFAALAVEDTGPGVPEEDRARIFEPFFTTGRGARPSGLGLAVLHGVVRRCRGAVYVEDGAGGGARFVLLFPSAPAPAVEAGTTSRRPDRSAEAAGVLLVEDDERLRRLLHDALVAAGFRVRAAGDAATALEAAGDGSGIDVLATDLQLPGASGQRLAEELRRRHPHVQVLYMSGHAPSRLERDRLEADEHLLAKPFTPDALVDGIAALLAVQKTEEA